MKTIFFDLDGTLTNLSDWPSLKLLIPRKKLFILRQKYQFGLITASKTPEAMRSLKKLGIAVLFEKSLIITSDICPETKITGAPFKLAKSKVKDIAAMIGDSEGDKIGSSKANLQFIPVSELSVEAFY